MKALVSGPLFFFCRLSPLFHRTTPQHSAGCRGLFKASLLSLASASRQLVPGGWCYFVRWRRPHCVPSVVKCFLLLTMPRDCHGKRNCVSDNSTPRNPREPEQLLFPAGTWRFGGELWQGGCPGGEAQGEGHKLTNTGSTCAFTVSSCHLHAFSCHIVGLGF